jgi:hypothetical protein
MMTECKECGDTFDSRSGLSRHLKTHDITIEDYLIKYKYNGEYPTCKCGCGEKTNYKSGKGDFCEYLKGHYARVNDDVSKAISGRTPWNKGKKRSEETKRKISESQSGENHPLYGKERSDEFKKNLSNKLSGRDAPWIDKAVETRENWSESRKREWRESISSTMKDKWRNGEYNVEDHPFYKDGRYTDNKDEYYDTYEDFTQSLKKTIRKRDNSICVLCEKPARAVHHIDENKKNSSKSNLITLCQSCHAFYHNISNSKQKDLRALFEKYTEKYD